MDDESKAQLHELVAKSKELGGQLMIVKVLELLKDKHIIDRELISQIASLKLGS